MNSFGKEVIIDLKNCDIKKFTRKSIEKYFVELCDLLKMNREDLHFWDYKDDPEGYEKAPDHLKGISAVQFITTSNITVHTLDVSKQILINIFSCKDFYTKGIIDFTKRYFKGNVLGYLVVNRGEK